ncbi:DUF6049 family protein [Nocardiopsis alba]|uniref:DUF6049 family protein n=1 Tax=Nocardiopsis alba TaxID=53437 RepID=UPI0033DA249A
MTMAAALLPIPATLSPASAEPENEESAPPVAVERITPSSLDEDSTLRVSGEVTNTTGVSVEDVTVRIRYSKNAFTSRDELDGFASGEGLQPDSRGPKKEFEGELKPDGTIEYSLSTPVEDLELGSYGVYPLVVEAVGGDGEPLGAQYTFLPYVGEDDKDVEPVDLAWVWPLMDDPGRADDDTFLGEGLHDSVTAEGRLGRLLEAGAQVPLSFDVGDEDLVKELGLNEDPSEEAEDPSPEAGSPSPDEEPSDSSPSPEESGEPRDEASASPEDEESDEDEDQDGGEKERSPERTEGIPVTWAVDPGTMDDILRMAAADHTVVEDLSEVPAGSDPERNERAADQAAQVWLREARGVLAADAVVASSYADTDLASLLRNDMRTDAEASLSISREALRRSLALEADERFALPAEGLMDEGVQELFSSDGADRFLLTEEALPPEPWIDTTLTAEVPLPATGAEEEGVDPFALVADAGLTEVLSMPSHGPGESALALQRFAAETAMIAGEDGGKDRVVVAAPSRDWDPSAELAAGVLKATDDLPWLSPERLDRVKTPDPDEWEDTRQDLNYPQESYGQELSSTYLGQIEDVSRDVRLFNSILVGDSDPFRPSLVRLESVYWREREALAGATRSLVSQAVQSRMEDVRIIPGEPVTLASRTGITGVLVANDLEDESVYVHLSIFSENSERLSIGDYTSSFEIAPGAKTTVYVPLSARINGSTTVHVSLQNADGEPISPQDTMLQVNATGLGTQALLISGIGLLILIAALAPRALRKWARRQAAKAEKNEDGESPSAETPRDEGAEAGDGEAAGSETDERSDGTEGSTSRDDGSEEAEDRPDDDGDARK